MKTPEVSKSLLPSEPLFTLTLEKLEPIFKTWLYEVLKASEPVPDPEPAFFTRHDVRRILHISLPTVDKYTHAGILKGQKCGNRILYSKDSIQEALKGISEVKFKRV
ncbi:MAG TPA: helix-turn-helix domain-containing protein [Bacteroidales bacterium]|nr:helix-turn-helix domain-containing protein [Bacteroidales bacterium]